MFGFDLGQVSPTRPAGRHPAFSSVVYPPLIEAQDRGLWRPRLNSTHGRLKALAGEKEAAADTAAE